MASYDRPPRILILDDHPLFREALAQILERNIDPCTMLMAPTLAAGRSLIEAQAPIDLVLVDLELPDSHGLLTLQAVQEALGPGGRVAVFSGTVDSALILNCLSLGARGYLPKTMTGEAVQRAIGLVLADEIYVPPLLVGQVETSRAVLAEQGATSYGQPPPTTSAAVDPRSLGFTDRQTSVLRLVLRGLPNKLICRELNLAEGTIKVHVSAVLRLLGVRNRTHAIIAARELGLIAGDPLPLSSSGFNRSPPAIQRTYAGRPRV